MVNKEGRKKHQGIIIEELSPLMTKEHIGSCDYSRHRYLNYWSYKRETAMRRAIRRRTPADVVIIS